MGRPASSGPTASGLRDDDRHHEETVTINDKLQRVKTRIRQKMPWGAFEIILPPACKVDSEADLTYKYHRRLSLGPLGVRKSENLEEQPIIAQLSLSEPPEVEYTDGATGKRLTIEEVHEFHKDGGQLHDIFARAIKDTTTMEKNLSTLVKWYYLLWIAADTTRGDCTTFANAVVATAQAIASKGGDSKRPGRKTRDTFQTFIESKSRQERLQRRLEINQIEEHLSRKHLIDFMPKPDSIARLIETYEVAEHVERKLLWIGHRPDDHARIHVTREKGTMIFRFFVGEDGQELVTQSERSTNMTPRSLFPPFKDLCPTESEWSSGQMAPFFMLLRYIFLKYKFIDGPGFQDVDSHEEAVGAAITQMQIGRNKRDALSHSTGSDSEATPILSSAGLSSRASTSQEADLASTTPINSFVNTPCSLSHAASVELNILDEYLNVRGMLYFKRKVLDSISFLKLKFEPFDARDHHHLDQYLPQKLRIIDCDPVTHDESEIREPVFACLQAQHDDPQVHFFQYMRDDRARRLDFASRDCPRSLLCQLSRPFSRVIERGQYGPKEAFLLQLLCKCVFLEAGETNGAVFGGTSNFREQVYGLFEFLHSREIEVGAKPIAPGPEQDATIHVQQAVPTPATTSGSSSDDDMMHDSDVHVSQTASSTAGTQSGHTGLATPITSPEPGNCDRNGKSSFEVSGVAVRRGADSSQGVKRGAESQSENCGTSVKRLREEDLARREDQLELYRARVTAERVKRDREETAQITQQYSQGYDAVQKSMMEEKVALLERIREELTAIENRYQAGVLECQNQRSAEMERMSARACEEAEEDKGRRQAFVDEQARIVAMSDSDYIESELPWLELEFANDEEQQRLQEAEEDRWIDEEDKRCADEIERLLAERQRLQAEKHNSNREERKQRMQKYQERRLLASACRR